MAGSAVSAQADRLALLETVTREQLMCLTSEDIRNASGQEEASEHAAQPQTAPEQPETAASNTAEAVPAEAAVAEQQANTQSQTDAEEPSGT